MVWLDKLLRLRSVAYIVVIAFVGFAIWQLLFHAIFMVVLRVHSMLAQHLISLTVETAGAATLTVIVVRALLQANRELTELHREKDMLTSIIVHDLRQPLTGLIGGLAGAAADPSLPTQTREMLALARESGGELIQMVNDLLDISRLEAGQPLTEKRAVAPDEFIRQGVRDLAQAARLGRVELSLALPEDLPQIVGDPGRLRRVVANLVGNAVKFTPAGGRVDVSARSDPSRQRLLVSVADTGIGVPAHLRHRIFDKFAVYESRSSGRSSTGLGLAFCKMVVEAHGGTIQLEGEEGHGSTFSFSLPLFARSARRAAAGGP
jgi:signal transduction histidine kinase